MNVSKFSCVSCLDISRDIMGSPGVELTSHKEWEQIWDLSSATWIDDSYYIINMLDLWKLYIFFKISMLKKCMEIPWSIPVPCCPPQKAQIWCLCCAWTQAMFMLSISAAAWPHSAHTGGASVWCVEHGQIKLDINLNNNHQQLYMHNR